MDTLLGNFLKVDSFRYIHKVVHGRTALNSTQRNEIYPSIQVRPDDINKRFLFYKMLLISHSNLTLFVDFL